MITLKPATSRLTVRAASTAFAALLALGLPLAAQSRGSHGGGGGGGSAHSSGGGSHSSSGGGHSSGGRTAHGTGGSSSGGQRQPGHGDGGHGGGHGGHGGGYWRGGHFYYYPFGFGFGFWPGYWDGWYGGGYYGGYYGDPYYYGDGGGYGREGRSDMGALDLDVSPGRTHVFVNGEDLGIVDRYDGWPGYLWLPQGTYDIAFYLPGYKTIARQITIYPGSVIDIDDGMEKGESVRPEDLASKSHARRDDRLRYERERQQWLDRQQSGDDDDQDWHDRVRHDRGAMHNDRGQGDDDRGDNDHGDDRARAPRASRDDSGRSHLRLTVEPQDASVYLDGQFVGTGTDVSLLHAGLPVAPGHHKLAVVRPGHKAVEKEFDVKSGGNFELEISLEPGSR
jgi:hypothetical protein